MQTVSDRGNAAGMSAGGLGTAVAAGKTDAVKPSEAASPVRSASPGFRFKITAEGFMLLIILILVGFAAWHSGTNLLYLIFAILTAIYLLHGFLLSVNLHRLEVEEHLPSVAVEGQPFEVTVVVHNRKRRLRSMAIRVSHERKRRGDVIGSAYFLRVRGSSRSETTYSAVGHKRGIFEFHRASIASRYPFGFEERAQLAPRSREVLILPKTWPVSSVVMQIPLGFGDLESNIRGSGTDLYGLREYVAGEPARHVHWRTSARAQKMMIAEYTREELHQILLVFDNSAGPGIDNNLSDDFENAVTLAASLARQLVESGYEVGLLTQDGDIHPGQSQAHLTEILRHLALIQPVARETLPVPANAVYLAWRQEQVQERNGSGTVIDSRAWSPSSAGAYTPAGEKRP